MAAFGPTPSCSDSRRLSSCCSRRSTKKRRPTKSSPSLVSQASTRPPPRLAPWVKTKKAEHGNQAKKKPGRLSRAFFVCSTRLASEITLGGEPDHRSLRALRPPRLTPRSPSSDHRQDHAHAGGHRSAPPPASSGIQARRPTPSRGRPPSSAR